MKTITLDTNNKNAVLIALETLNAGGLVAFPTDTVYGLGALAYNAAAIESIYTAKKRPPEKAIPILIGSTEELNKVTTNIPHIAAKLAEHFWPGPLTLIVPKHPDLPEIISSTKTVGVRVPKHALAQALLNAAGPMAVTSANISGRASPNSAADVRHQLNGSIPLILDGGETQGGLPSTVVNCLGPEAVILRAGPITMENIQAVLD